MGAHLSHVTLRTEVRNLFDLRAAAPNTQVSAWQFRRAFESRFEAIVVFDDDGKDLLANPAPKDGSSPRRRLIDPLHN